MRLTELQSSFKSLIQPAVVTPEDTGYLVHAERLGVYAHGYRARIHEALAECFEAVRRVVDKERFWDLSDTYAVHYPSHDYNLNYVGRHLPEFLANHALLGEFPFLKELAAFEWKVWQAFHAFQERSFRKEELARIPLEDWERARIQFQPSVSLVVSEWPVLDLWLKRKSKEDLKSFFAKNEQRILIGRKNDQVRCERLEEPPYLLLEALLSGKTLGRTLEVLSDLEGSEHLPVAAWFGRWVEDGLIHTCILDAPVSC